MIANLVPETLTTLYSLAVGLAVAAAFSGYGSLVLRATGQRYRTDPAMAAAVGLAAYLALCGFIELLGIASVGLFAVFTLIGCIGALWAVRDTAARSTSAVLRHKPLLALLFFIQLTLVISVATWRFHNMDDLQGYLVLAERILQTGSTGIDPFLFRRIEAGLGGSNYLFALVLAFVDFAHIRIADIGIGSLILCLLVLDHARASERGGRWAALGVAVALCALLFAPVVNLTPDATAIALLYAALRLALVLARSENSRWQDHLPVALLLFALACLRTTYIASAVSVYAALYITLFLRGDRRRVVGVALVTAAFGLALTLPWMAVCMRIAGTPLYPFLGFGTLAPDEVVGYAAPPVLLRSMVMVGACYGLALVSLAYMLASRRTESAAALFLTVFTLLALAAISLSQLKFTLYAAHYSYVPLTAIPLFLLVESFHYDPPERASRVWHFALIAAVAPFVLVKLRNPPESIFYGQLSWVRADAPGDPYSSDALATLANPRRLAALSQQIVALQASVPTGARMLVRLDYPFLLDFRRNDIWVMDHPGVIGPPPGVPSGATVAAWRRYLAILNVGYIAYAYADEAGDSAALNAAFLTTLTGPSHWQETIATRTAVVQATLLKLKDSHRPVFDDGSRYVVALDPSVDNQ